jgi:hypothetical protein
MGWVFNATPQLFTPGNTRYPLYRRLDGHQGRSGGVRKISLLPGFDPRTVQPVASPYTAIPAHSVGLIYEIKRCLLLCRGKNSDAQFADSDLLFLVPNDPPLCLSSLLNRVWNGRVHG